MSKNVFFLSLGCKVNRYETDAVRASFENRGYKTTDCPQEADVYIVNTCTVTGEADRKSRQMIRKARKTAPNAVIVAMGCHVEMNENEQLADLSFGTAGRSSIVDEVEAYMALSKNDSEAKNSIAQLPIETDYFERGPVLSREETRAFIKIEDGCNNFCSYCIIPFARGRVRSRSREAILQEIEALGLRGFHEFVLTGIHICSFEKELGHDISALSELLVAIEAIPNVRRIRLGSLEPYSITPAFISTIKTLSKLCPHFHLSLQSGCDTVLARMNRKYTSAEYEAVVMQIREAMPQALFTTDIIVGFPGETEEEHDASMAFCKKISFSHIHVFPYSKRDGTKAAAMKEHVSPEVQARRAEAFRLLSEQMENSILSRYEGKPVDVLVEKLHDDGSFTGYSAEYLKSRGNACDIKNSAPFEPGDIVRIPFQRAE